MIKSKINGIRFILFACVMVGLLPILAINACAANWDSNPMSAQQVNGIGISWYEIGAESVGLGIQSGYQNGYSGNARNLTLPSSIDGKRVTEIAGNAFSESGIRTVRIPESVVTIHGAAFEGCKQLSKVYIPASVTTCGSSNNSPFSYCDLLVSAGPIGSGCNIEFGWTTTMPKSSFYHCQNLRKLILPDGLQMIPSQLAESCDLSSISIPESVKTIDYRAFSRNKNLGPSLTIPANCTEMIGECFTNCLGLETVTIKGATQTSGHLAPFTGCDNLKTIYLESCLASKKWQNPTMVKPAAIIWSHKLVGDWGPWAKTHLAVDHNGQQLWNGQYRHYRTGQCEVCGIAYDFAPCEFDYESNWKSDGYSYHSRRGICRICGESGYFVEPHTNVGNWYELDERSHARNINCDVCGYVGTETQEHQNRYGSWEQCSDTQHQRSAKCRICGHQGLEYSSHRDNNADGYCDDCGYEMSHFSVTVPADMQIVISENGEVYCSEVSIENHSTAVVSIEGISVEVTNGWTLVPFDTNMADQKVDTKLIGINVNGVPTLATGVKEDLLLTHGWNIDRDCVLPLNCDAVVSASSDPVSEQVMTVCFIVNWAVAGEN